MGDEQFVIGAEVLASDGVCGTLRRLVVDPIAKSITHLVVESTFEKGTGHLVPIVLVESADAGSSFAARESYFHDLEYADETVLLRGASGLMPYGAGQLLSRPYFALAVAEHRVGREPPGTIASAENMPVAMGYDRVPLGEVEIRRGQKVNATDGHVGTSRGLVIDPRDHHVTHVLLEEGHLFGKRQVAIPVTSVDTIEHDEVHLSITRSQAEALPAVALASAQS